MSNKTAAPPAAPPTTRTQRPALTLIRGDKHESECYCDEPDVYDGYAECPAHPAGANAPQKRTPLAQITTD